LAYIAFDLGTGSNAAEDGHAGACRHVNCHVEELGEDAKGIKAIVSSDGFVNFATLANSGAVRATFAVTANLLLVVAGRLLFSVDQTGTATVVGGIPSDGHVSMARNREAPDPTVAIVCDGLVWYYKAGVLTQNTDPDLPPPVSVTGVDGYFSFQAADGRNFASGLDDPDVNALSFASAEAKADPGIVNWTRGRDLMLGGTETIEAWDNQGNDPYPFVRTTIVTRAEDGKFIGVLAPGGVSEGFFVGSDKTVRMLQGYQARRISTHAVERAIADDPSPFSISVATWDSRGHTHYAISGTSWTWVYNSTTGKWYERESYGLTRWKVATAVQFGDKVILGDYAEGKLYRLDHGTYTEAGGHLISTIQTPPVHGFPYGFKHTALYLDVVPAVGTLTTPHPMLMLDWSDDGGRRSWSAQRMIDLGGPSQALKRVKVTRLGVSRSRTYRLSMSADARRCFISAGVEVEKLRA
jgi:hypothetical protein